MRDHEGFPVLAVVAPQSHAMACRHRVTMMWLPRLVLANR